MLSYLDYKKTPPTLHNLLQALSPKVRGHRMSDSIVLPIKLGRQLVLPIKVAPPLRFKGLKLLD